MDGADPLVVERALDRVGFTLSVWKFGDRKPHHYFHVASVRTVVTALAAARADADALRNQVTDELTPAVEELLVAADKRRMDEITYDEWCLARDEVRRALSAVLSTPAPQGEQP